MREMVAGEWSLHRPGREGDGHPAVVEAGLGGEPGRHAPSEGGRSRDLRVTLDEALAGRGERHTGDDRGRDEDRATGGGPFSTRMLRAIVTLKVPTR